MLNKNLTDKKITCCYLNKLLKQLKISFKKNKLDYEFIEILWLKLDQERKLCKDCF